MIAQIIMVELSFFRVSGGLLKMGAKDLCLSSWYRELRRRGVCASDIH